MEPKHGYIIPFQQSLELLLKHPEVAKEVIENHPHDDDDDADMKYDICDGTFCRNHPVFVEDPSGIKIMIYYDDIEVLNPIGHHTKKHKLSMFYWTLLNIKPVYRSQFTVCESACFL